MCAYSAYILDSKCGLKNIHTYKIQIPSYMYLSSHTEPLPSMQPNLENHNALQNIFG